MKRTFHKSLTKRRHARRIRIECFLFASVLLGVLLGTGLWLKFKGFENVRMAVMTEQGGMVVLDETQQRHIFYVFDEKGRLTGKSEGKRDINASGPAHDYTGMAVYRGDIYVQRKEYDDAGILLNGEILRKRLGEKDTVIYSIQSDPEHREQALFGALSVTDDRLIFLLANMNGKTLTQMSYDPENGVSEAAALTAEGLSWGASAVCTGGSELVFADLDSVLFSLGTEEKQTSIIRAGAVHSLAGTAGAFAYFDLYSRQFTFKDKDQTYTDAAHWTNRNQAVSLCGNTVVSIEEDGQKLGKTVLFAVSPTNAEWKWERFSPCFLTWVGWKMGLPYALIAVLGYLLLRGFLFLLMERSLPVMKRVLMISIPMLAVCGVGFYLIFYQMIYREIKTLSQHRLHELVSYNSVKLKQIKDAILLCDLDDPVDSESHLAIETMLYELTETDWRPGPNRSLLYYAVITRRDDRLYILNSTRYTKGSDMEGLYKEGAYNDLRLCAGGEPVPEFTESPGRRTFYFYQTPVKNAWGEIAAVLEFGIDLNMIAVNAEGIARRQSVTIIGLLCLMIAVFLLVLHSVLRALSSLKDAVNRITQGNQNVLVQVKTKDEIGDISQAFNLMSAYVDQRNKESIAYNRFVPQEIHALLGENTASAGLGDRTDLPLSLLCAGIHGLFEENNPFDRFNRCYAQIAAATGRGEGFMQPMEPTCGFSLFRPPNREVLETALELYESLREDGVTIALDFGVATVSVMGMEERLQIAVLSPMTERLRQLQTYASLLGSGVLITGDFYQSLEEPKLYRHRYLGMVVLENYSIALYDFFDADSPDRFRRKQESLEDFNAGIDCFYRGERKKARDRFVRVLRLFPEDNISRQYLFLCEGEELCLTVQTTLS